MMRTTQYLAVVMSVTIMVGSSPSQLASTRGEPILQGAPLTGVGDDWCASFDSISHCSNPTFANRCPTWCSGNIDTSICKFPFIYNNVTYSGCTTNNDPKKKYWCSTKTDNQNKHIMGNWAHCIGSLPDVIFPDSDTLLDMDNKKSGTKLEDRTINDNSDHQGRQDIKDTTKPTQAPSLNLTQQVNTRLPGCTVRPDPGECRGAFVRFYYNETLDQCDCFLFGGCDEELVEFTWLSFDQCVSTCVPGITSKGPRCVQATAEDVLASLSSTETPVTTTNPVNKVTNDVNIK